MGTKWNVESLLAQTGDLAQCQLELKSERTHCYALRTRLSCGNGKKREDSLQKEGSIKRSMRHVASVLRNGVGKNARIV